MPAPQLRAQGGKRRFAARRTAGPGAGNFLHGMDQFRQPKPVAKSRFPYLELRSHRLSLRVLLTLN
jgi:hypothetical protein